MLLLVALLAGGGWWWLQPADEPPPVAQVARGDIELLVTATGTLEPRRSVDVGAQVSGQVKHIHVQIGDTVKRGQLLLEIDPDVQQAVVDGPRWLPCRPSCTSSRCWSGRHAGSCSAAGIC